MTETLSIKVPKELKARLRAAAKSRQVKPSALLREALELVISLPGRRESRLGLSLKGLQRGAVFPSNAFLIAWLTT
jgi:predicted transcriptional regulator